MFLLINVLYMECLYNHPVIISFITDNIVVFNLVITEQPGRLLGRNQCQAPPSLCYQLSVVLVLLGSPVGLYVCG